ncbi:TetR/AcrR family transcriptional regulator [Nocardiopsis sp. CC223A]|uniref:TetR/AcrR family transcriptional regulator n=1 Tax=Nocardiopsis sp. CC223A TaxID=3044051 RepID=UPI00278BF815|nr:TetR family transcriptional regulator [Nocardiopsis sp. CC223A]
MERTDRDPPRTRDPERRRRAIVKAAADLIVGGGAARLTHRRVAARAQVSLGSTTYHFSSLAELKTAALEHLTREGEVWLERVRTTLADHDGDPRGLCDLIADYLADRAQVTTDFALAAAAADDPALRPLALIWFDGLVEALCAYTDPDTARAVAVFTDGALIHALLHDAPLDTAALYRSITALLSAAPRRTP